MGEQRAHVVCVRVSVHVYVLCVCVCGFFVLSDIFFSFQFPSLGSKKWKSNVCTFCFVVEITF